MEWPSSSCNKSSELQLIMSLDKTFYIVIAIMSLVLSIYDQKDAIIHFWSQLMLKVFIKYKFCKILLFKYRIS